MRIAQLSFLIFAATLGIDWPAPPIPGHAAWADLFMLVAAVSLAISLAISRPRLRELFSPVSSINPAFAFAIAYSAWAALSAFVTRNGTLKALGYAELLCVLITASLLCRDTAYRNRLIRAFIIGVAFLSLTGLAGSALAITGHSTMLGSHGGAFGWPFRPKGLTVGIDMLATLCVPPLLLLLDIDAPLLQFPRKLRLALLVLFAITLGLTFSRSSIALLIGLSCLRIHNLSRRLIIIGLLLVPLFIALRFDLVLPGSGFTTSTAPGLRLRIAQSALHTAIQYPIFGTGPNGPAALVGDWPQPSDDTIPWDAHFTALDIAATLGIPALLFFTGLLFFIVRLRPKSRPLDRVLRIIAIVLVVESLSIDIEDFRHVWLFLGIVLSSEFIRVRTNQLASLSIGESR